MKQSWNPALWLGFALVLAGTLSYQYFFIRFPVTRDFPWANLILLAIAFALIAVGLRRAYGQPDAYRGKIFGPILAVLGVCAAGFFLFVVFYFVKLVPASAGAPRAGAAAPEFTIPDSLGRPVTLSTLLATPFQSNDWPQARTSEYKSNGLVLIFYRGYW